MQLLTRQQEPDADVGPALMDDKSKAHVQVLHDYDPATRHEYYPAISMVGGWMCPVSIGAWGVALLDAARYARDDGLVFPRCGTVFKYFSHAGDVFKYIGELEGTVRLLAEAQASDSILEAGAWARRAWRRLVVAAAVAADEGVAAAGAEGREGATDDAADMGRA